MQVINIHTCDVPSDATRVGPLLDSLASRDDRIWPSGKWPSMRLDRPLGVGARGGHGPIRYTVTQYVPGQRIRFVFDRPAGFDGYHEFRIEPRDGSGCRLVHELRMRTRGAAVVTWPLVFGPLHDALIEDAFAHGASSLGLAGPWPEWSLRVRVTRRLLQAVLPKRRSARNQTA